MDVNLICFLIVALWKGKKLLDFNVFWLSVLATFHDFKPAISMEVDNALTWISLTPPISLSLALFIGVFLIKEKVLTSAPGSTPSRCAKRKAKHYQDCRVYILCKGSGNVCVKVVLHVYSLWIFQRVVGAKAS